MKRKIVMSRPMCAYSTRPDVVNAEPTGQQEIDGATTRGMAVIARDVYPQRDCSEWVGNSKFHPFNAVQSSENESKKCEYHHSEPTVAFVGGA